MRRRDTWREIFRLYGFVILFACLAAILAFAADSLGWLSVDVARWICIPLAIIFGAFMTRHDDRPTQENGK